MEAFGSFGWFLLINILIIMLIAFIFYWVRSYFKNDSGNGRENKNIEQKLDRIIELLEKEKRNDHL